MVLVSVVTGTVFLVTVITPLVSWLIESMNVVDVVDEAVGSETAVSS